MILASHMATLTELQSVLGSEDAMDMLEVLAVDSHNESIRMKEG